MKLLKRSTENIVIDYSEYSLKPSSGSSSELSRSFLKNDFCG